MRLFGRWEYTLIAFSRTQAAVCRFRKAARGKYRLVSRSSVPAGEKDPAEAVRTALREAGGAQGCIVLCGDVSGGGFFRCPALPVPGVTARRSALEFELPRRLTEPPADPVIQFIPADRAEDALWNVYAFPKSGFLSLAALLSASRKKADELIHPLLAVRSGDPDVMLPLLERDFVFSHGQWRPAGEADRVLSPFWEQEFRKLFILPDSLPFSECMECLLVMRLLMSDIFRDGERGVRILPASLRPKRLRLHLAATIVLLLLLGGIHLKSVAYEAVDRAKEYSTLVSERDNYRRKSARLRTSLKKEEKECRELQRVLQMEEGDRETLTRLEDLTSSLPSDMLVTSLRFNGMTADLILQSESASTNLPSSLKSIRYWKIAQLQQRTMGENLTMTILKLVPAEESR